MLLWWPQWHCDSTCICRYSNFLIRTQTHFWVRIGRGNVTHTEMVIYSKINFMRLSFLMPHINKLYLFHNIRVMSSQNLCVRTTQIARFMGPTWAHLGPVSPRWAPCWPHKPCCQGRFQGRYLESGSWLQYTVRCNCTVKPVQRDDHLIVLSFMTNRTNMTLEGLRQWYDKIHVLLVVLSQSRQTDRLIDWYLISNKHKVISYTSTYYIKFNSLWTSDAYMRR